MLFVALFSDRVLDSCFIECAGDLLDCLYIYSCSDVVCGSSLISFSRQKKIHISSRRKGGAEFVTVSVLRWLVSSKHPNYFSIAE